MKISRPDAIASLLKGTHFHIDGNLNIHYFDNQTALTEEEIDAEIIRLEKEYSDNEFSRNRQAEYPSIQECVHAILDDDLDALQKKRAEIKKKYPKG